MLALNNLGKISAATMVLYIPVLIIAGILVFRHGFTKDAGWIFIALFSLTRVIGGALMIAAEEIRPVNVTLYIIAFVLESAGLSPLLLATLGFLKTIVHNSFGQDGMTTRVFRLLGLLATIALALSIYGGTEASSSSQSSQKSSNQLRQIGAILFLVLYVLLVGVHVFCWMRSSLLMKNRRTLLVAISSALPFLGVRVIYSVLSAYSGSLVLSPSSSTAPAKQSSLAAFNMVTGDWPIYLCMSVLMEAITVVIYTTAGIKIPLQQDYHAQAKFEDDEHPLYAVGGQTAYNPPYGAPPPQGGRYVPPYAVSTDNVGYESSPYAPQAHIAYAPPPGPPRA